MAKRNQAAVEAAQLTLTQEAPPPAAEPLKESAQVTLNHEGECFIRRKPSGTPRQVKGRMNRMRRGFPRSQAEVDQPRPGWGQPEAAPASATTDSTRCRSAPTSKSRRRTTSR